MEVDGSDPPFLLPGAGAGVLRNSHLRNTPWWGRSRPKYPWREGSCEDSWALLLAVLALMAHQSAQDAWTAWWSACLAVLASAVRVQYALIGLGLLAVLFVPTKKRVQLVIAAAGV